MFRSFVLAVFLTAPLAAQSLDIVAFEARRRELRERYQNATSPDAKKAILAELRALELTPGDDGSPGGGVPSPFDAADPGRIGRTLKELTADGVLDVADLEPLIAAAGGRIKPDEFERIRAAILGQVPDAWPDYEVPEETLAAAREWARTRDLAEDEAAELLTERTFGGTEVPEAVRRVIEEARLAGAIAYDVNETETNSDGEEEGVWSPYPAVTPATGNMAFDYTEITPEKLRADIEDTDVTYLRITGTEKRKEIGADGKEFEYEAATYTEGKGGTGNVLAHYDHAWHEDLYARGRSGQKWANNFAILSDGSVHALPASRRHESNNLILTNPHLSRGMGMLFNGHLDIREGVVVGVEMSGRLSRRAAEGKNVFVDPIAVLEAWGFEIAPGVRVRYGNTSRGTPVRDPITGTIGAAGQGS